MNRIKKLRQSKKYTQIKIQIETGIDQSNYSKIELGKREPTFTECKKLALLFGTSMDYIAGITDEITPYPRSAKV